jgi:hypothetical protein
MEIKMRDDMLKFCCIFLVLCSLLCWNCSGSIHQIYEGQPLSIEEITQVFCSNYISKIIDIDGKIQTRIKHSFFTGGPKIALLPGKHTITMVFATNEERTITFTAEAGRSYELDRWGDNAVLIDMRFKQTWTEYQSKLYKGRNEELIQKRIKSFVAPLPKENSVIVRSLEHDPDVRLVRVDKKNYSSTNTGFALSMTPGPHSFELWVDITRGFFQADYYSKKTQEISADLEPNCTYVIYAEVDTETKIWKPVILKDIYHSVNSEATPINQ